MEQNNEQKSEFDNIQGSKASGTHENEFRNEPITETQISKSKDGKYIIHKTIITDIKPVKYYEKILENQE